MENKIKYSTYDNYELCGLINKESIPIIKRCILYKEIGNNIVNDQNKLKGILRKENNFIINDSKLNEIIIENYDELIPKDILEKLNSNEIINTKIDLSILDEYLINNFVYKFNNIYISKNKIIKNMNKILNTNIKNIYSYSELLYYSIIYNYPKLLTSNNLEKLKNILNIKQKKLK